MKKSLYLLGIALLICSGLSVQTSYADCNTCETTCSYDCNSCECEVTAKSFFSMRGFFDDPTSPAKVSLIRQAVQELPTRNGSLVQVVPFGGKTRNDKQLAWYFGPSCKRVLHVAANPARNPDILSENLGIYTQNDEFESNFCLSPEQKFAGVGFNYRTHFLCKDENRGFFLDVTLPVYSVENKMNLAEDVTNTGGGVLVAGGPANVTEAFKQPSWNFGRINDCCKMRKTGVSMLDIQLGYGWGKDQAHMHSYLGVLIPTGNKVTSEYVFEPIIGWNHHTAIHFGSSFGIKLWENECGDRSIWYELAIDSRFFFENEQCRTFDLKGKPWSRYMTVYANRAQAVEASNLCTGGNVDQGTVLGTPGVNIFTQRVKVQPRFQRSYNTAFVVDLGDLTLEGGYNFFSRDSECVKLACPWEELVGITTQRQSDGTFVATDGPALKDAIQACGFTNGAQTIGKPFLGSSEPVANYADNIITVDQIDFSSAEAPCLLSHWIYGSVGYTIDCGCVRTLLGLGAGYEFSGDNAGADRLGAWAKVAVIF